MTQRGDSSTVPTWIRDSNRPSKWLETNDPPGRGELPVNPGALGEGTPLIVMRDGAPLMLSAGAKAAYGYDPRTGRELWRVQYPDWSTAPRPSRSMT